jgi:hypothetical protein
MDPHGPLWAPMGEREAGHEGETVAMEVWDAAIGASLRGPLSGLSQPQSASVGLSRASGRLALFSHEKVGLKKVGLRAVRRLGNPVFAKQTFAHDGRKRPVPRRALPLTVGSSMDAETATL